MDLLTAIRQNSQQALQKQGVTDETQKAQDLLSARSGKAQVGSGLKKTTNIGEQQAVAQTNQQLGQLAQSAELQSQGLAQDQEAQQNQFNQQSQTLEQQRQGIELRNQQQTREILNNLKRSKADLDQKQYEAQLDQAAQDVRLSTTKYVDNLQREGNRARLNDALAFEQEMTKASLGANADLLQKQLAGKSVLAANDREFKEAMGSMNINNAYAMLNNEISAQKQGAMWSGIGGLTNAGIGAYSTYDKNVAEGEEMKRKAAYYKGAGKDVQGYEADKYRNMTFEDNE